MKGWRTIVGALAFVTVIASASPAGAAVLDDAGWGMLTVLTNVVYMPVKLVYATLGGLTGACALGLTGGDMQTAESVWVTSMGGTYVVTPGMLRGEEVLAFTGTPGAPDTAAADNRGVGGVEEQQLGGNHGAGGGVEEQQLGGS
jgi:hypothetical protein